MNKKQIAKHLVTVGIFTLITTFIVVSLQSYRNLTDQKSQVGQGLKLDLLNSEIEMTILDDIESRKEYSLQEVRIVSTPIPSQEPVLDDQVPATTLSGELTDE